MNGRDDYKLLEVKDAMSCFNQKVNLIGVILELGFPRRTKGTDWFCALKLIDQSYKKPGLTVNMFAERLETLPCVASAGDIIQLSNVVMKAYGGEINAVFNKKFSSFALYKGKDGHGYLPYHVSPKFQPRDTDLDKKLIMSLRGWGDCALDEGSTYSLVKDIKEGQEVNLLCKIVYVSEDAEDGAVVFVWDGTDAVPISMDSTLEKQIVNTHQLRSLPLPRDILCTLPPVGSILRLILDQGIEKQSLHMLIIGTWVKFVNVICETQVGLFHILVKTFSKLRFTTHEDHLVMERQRLYDERVSLKWGRIPLWSYPWPSPITGVDHKNISFATLMDALTYPEVNAKFRCVVRVLAVYPSDAKDFRTPSGSYLVRLSLEDPTARFHAFLYDEDGYKFFGGDRSIEALTSIRNKLLGVPRSEENVNALRNPPWVQCCLKSYYTNKGDVWGSRQFRIFDTTVLGDY